MDPLQLDWTRATIELINEQHKAAVHVFNHDLSTPEAIDRTIRFVTGRGRWFRRQLPPGTSQGAWLDDRDQRLSDSAKQQIRQALSSEFVSVVFMSEKAK